MQYNKSASPKLSIDEVSRAVPTGTLAEGLAAAFRSDSTAGLGQMVPSLFAESSGYQKAGLLNHFISSVTPATLMQILRVPGFCQTERRR